ncbi:hypothetical protein [Pseudomonas sp. A-RE-19]|uniref:hypothetical protein n=1 Tax=Pseudomonas sp. A-RE-19 TaxID=2832401 RepID=UPI001CBF8E83|nr:hypothetical protein [Pseudomonas sp. A-RE-19]
MSIFNFLSKKNNASERNRVVGESDVYHASISMFFEDELLKGSKEKNSFVASWVDSEIKSSEDYFNSELRDSISKE